MRINYKYDHVIETCKEGGSVYADKIELEAPFRIVSPASMAYNTALFAGRAITAGVASLAKKLLSSLAVFTGVASVSLSDDTTIFFNEIQRFNMKCGPNKVRETVKYQVRVTETWSIGGGRYSMTHSRTWIKPDYVILSGACCCKTK